VRATADCSRRLASAGQNLSALAARGVTVPFPDALIATVAIDNDLEVWHHDVHFTLMHTVLPQLRLFKEPT
jgi:predicted nucleic acid-binding protein